MRDVSIKSASRLDGMRLMLESTPSDEELLKRAENVDTEVEAVDQALVGNGSYLGIQDKVSARVLYHLCFTRHSSSGELCCLYSMWDNKSTQEIMTIDSYETSAAFQYCAVSHGYLGDTWQ